MKTLIKRTVLKIVPARKRENWAISLLNSIGYGETTLDSEVNNFFSKIPRPLDQPFAILDIGASEGDWAEMALSKSELAVLHCFEPQIKPLNMLKSKLQNEIHKKRLYTHNFALGQESKLAHLYSIQEGAGSASLFQRQGSDYRIVSQILIKEFSSAISEINIPIIGMKIDTEGYEFEILSSAKTLLGAEHFRLVQFEFGEYTIEKKQSFRQYFDFLTMLDFRLYRMSKYGLALIPKYDARLEIHWNTNYLAVKNS